MLGRDLPTTVSVSQFKTYLDISAGDEVVAKLRRIHNLSKNFVFYHNRTSYNM